MQIVVRTEGLPENLIKYLESHLVLQIRRNNAILLKDNNDSVQVTTKKNKIQIVIRSYFRVRIEPYVFFTPFEILDLVASFYFKKVLVNYKTD